MLTLRPLGSVNNRSGLFNPYTSHERFGGFANKRIVLQLTRGTIHGVHIDRGKIRGYGWHGPDVVGQRIDIGSRDYPAARAYYSRILEQNEPKRQSVRST